MAVNKIEIALKEALKKAMVKCNFVDRIKLFYFVICFPDGRKTCRLCGHNVPADSEINA